MPIYLRMCSFIVIATLFLSACELVNTMNSSGKNTPLWIQDQGFISPESAVYDQNRNQIIVSNVNGYTNNQQGYLSRLSLDGELLDQAWLRGLNGPTGMAIWQDTLFVADIDRLVAVNLTTAKIVAEYPAPDATPGLNDVTVSTKGEVYVTGSASKSVYHLENDNLTLWTQHPQLKYANGIYAADDRLWVAGYHLRWFSYEDKSIHTPGLDEDLEDLESVEPDGKGGIIITKIGEGPIYHYSADGELLKIMVRDTFSADIEYIQSKNLLIVPSGKNRVFAFEHDFD